MKQLFFLIFGFIILTNLHSQNDVPYLSAKLVPYSVKLDILENPVMENMMYTQLYTGAGDFFKCFFGTGVYRGNTIYWVQYDFVTKKDFSILGVEKDDEKNICTGTVKRTFMQDANTIAFDFKLNLTTNEIQYNWLDKNNKYCENAVVISADKAIKRGKIFPDLTLNKPDGNTISLHDFAGKIIVINWWAIGCRPCRAEIPGLNQLVELYKENPNVVFIAIADNDKGKVEGFLDNHEFNYIQTLANQEARALFDPSYPQHIIIDSTGEIYHHGASGSEKIFINIDEKIKKLLTYQTK